MAAPKHPKPRYVLVIEDNANHAELLTEVLDRHFAPVIIHTVDTIEDGIEFAGQTAYDLIITGGVIRQTPVTDSIQKLSRMAGGTPIVVISGRGDERLAAEFIKRGAVEYLGKTRETLENLPALLEKHLTHKRKARQQKAPSAEAGTRAGIPSPKALIREVDRITQQALAIAGPKRRKRRLVTPDVEQLDRLLGQIQKLRELAMKLTPKE
ncbi:MAG: response regulator [Pseudomonadota bacterium]